MGKVIKLIAGAAGLVLACTHSASAEMGKAPVGPGGVYGGFTAAYTRSDEPETEINSSIPAMMPSVKLVEIDPNGGLQGALHFGHVLSSELFGLENFRIEGGLSFTSSDTDDTQAGVGFSVRAVTGLGFIVINPVTRSVEQESSVWSGTLALKGDVVESEGFSLPVAVEFFTVHSDDSIRFGVMGQPKLVFSNVDAHYYGVMGALEPELQLSEMFSIVARLAGGIYAYDFDGEFGDFTGPNVRFSDSENGVGARVEGVLGLKLFLSSALSLTFFGGVDYWSDTPIANFPEAAGTFAFVDRTDMVKFKAGVTATIALGGQ